MAKELPYFRFTVQEWQNGKISTLNDSLKGIFIDICAYYWAQNCNVTFESLTNKFKTKLKSIQKLIESETVYNQNGIISISFLDQQLSELKQTKSFFSEMGKLGQKVKKNQASLKKDLSYKDNIKEDKDNIPKRKHSFEKSPYFDFSSFKERLSDWPIERVEEYHEKAKNYSIANGGKYLDWVQAVRNWYLKETKKQKGTSIWD